MVTEVKDWFSESYSQARERFLQNAKSAGAELFALPLPTQSPRGEPLSIDIAWLGPRPFTKIFLHTSGVHGVEGFAGSAIQSLMLSRGVRLPASTAAVFVHAVNPYGMAWWRRVNENNVDLNRNFLSPGEPYSGMDQKYEHLSAFLNPKENLGRFWFGLASHVLRHGFEAAKKAVTEGQYEIQEGLFFGGKRLEAGPSLLKAWARQHLSSAVQALILDVHTGLGRFGQETLFYHGLDPVPGIGKRPTSLKAPIGYKVRGGLESLSAEIFAGRAWSHFTQEFGTYSMFEALRVLRAENWSFRKDGKVGAWQHQLLRTMYPENESWRVNVLRQGTERIERSLSWLENCKV